MTNHGKRLADLFAAALDLPADQREAFVDEATAGDARLREELREMLAADAGAAAQALEELMPVGSGGLPAGTLVAGRYRIVRLLGEGGMGVVYEAQQLQPVRTVALKCMRASLATPAAQQRFEREAATLGRLRHPGIAQILEAGSTGGPEGQPFFAMEHVQGPHLLEYAAKLGLHDRIELFAEICDAVQHAHANGIVHRDLKPANVLIDTSGLRPQPKVLDFGIARSVDAEGTMLTRTHEIVGTLAFLAPELLAGSRSADPRADVWSLGVMLFQLLTGRLPFALEGLSLVVAARLVQDQEPPPVDRLVASLRGDVATIVHACLAKDPARRYANAGALAADLRRHLVSVPIAARPASTFYRLSRFTRRNRAMVAGFTATILALAGGLAASLYFLQGEHLQRSRAEQRANELRALARELIFDVEGKLRDVPGATSARQLLVTTGLRHAESLLADAGDDPGLLTEVGAAFQKLAEILGDPSGSNLGDLAGAENALAKAEIALQRALQHGGGGQTCDALYRTALVRAELARAQSRPEQRRMALQQAREFAERMRAAGLGERADRALERAHADLGRLLHEAGDHRAALVHLQQYVAAQERRLANGDTSVVFNLILVLRMVGGVHRALAEYGEARSRYLRAIELGEQRLLADGPRSEAAAQLANALRDLASLDSKLGQHAAALPLLDRARDLVAGLPVEDKDIAAQRQMMILEHYRVDALLGLERLEEADAAVASYLQAAEALRRRSPNNWNRVRDVMLGWLQRTGIRSRRGDEPGAWEAYQETLRLVQECQRGDPESLLFLEDLAKAHKKGGDACMLFAEQLPAQAAEWRRKARVAFTAEAEALRALVQRGAQSAWIAQRNAAVETLLASLLEGG